MSGLSNRDKYSVIEGLSGCQEARGNTKLSFAGLAHSQVFQEEHLFSKGILIDSRKPMLVSFQYSKSFTPDFEKTIHLRGTT